MIARLPHRTATARPPDQRRGLVPALETPHPIARYLPGLYQDDYFAQRLLAALDAVLAPIFATLDNLEAYLDPWLAPPDFLDWIATWLGLSLDDGWPLEQRRAFVAHAHELFRLRGTARGLKRQVEIFTGGTVEIEDTGGVSSSATGAALPGSPNFALVVRIRVDDPATVDVPALDALVAQAKPADVTHRIEVVPLREATDPVEVTSG